MATKNSENPVQAYSEAPMAPDNLELIQVPWLDHIPLGFHTSTSNDLPQERLNHSLIIIFR